MRESRRATVTRQGVRRPTVTRQGNRIGRTPKRLACRIESSSQSRSSAEAGSDQRYTRLKLCGYIVSESTCMNALGTARALSAVGASAACPARRVDGVCRLLEHILRCVRDMEAPERRAQRRVQESLRGASAEGWMSARHQKPSEAIRSHRKPSEAIGSHQKPLEAIRSLPTPGHQKQPNSR